MEALMLLMLAFHVCLLPCRFPMDDITVEYVDLN